ncbi:hypothetical protein ACQP2U_42505 (plasmid) [Nocardia sp. CA-084685]|uniref:hypothetical protein n=1 Tax=Nocardia sp. CA-084685 TaxID=3239970 RepID=UPI003D98EC8D
MSPQPVRYYVTDGPLAVSVREEKKDYFLEAALFAETGVVRVVLRDGSIDLIAGSRYLQGGTRIRAEVDGDQLRVLYLGVCLREYDDWVDFTDPLPESEFPR